MIKLEVKDFNLEQTLECGQCFRFKKLDDLHYVVQVMNQIAEIKQIGNILEIDDGHDGDTFNSNLFWSHYFDLNTDYDIIKKTLSKDKILKPYIEYGSGIHILNQPFEEVLISFLMSINNNIPNIKRCIENYSRVFGDLINFKGNQYYSFPDYPKIRPTLEEIQNCKLGFRAKFIVDNLQRLQNGYYHNIELFTFEQQYDILVSAYGIGPKVANCVLLFGLHRVDSFPIDVWIKRKMQDLYFDGQEVSNKTIQQFATNQFGEFAGYAQQYIFYKSITK